MDAFLLLEFILVSSEVSHRTARMVNPMLVLLRGLHIPVI